MKELKLNHYPSGLDFECYMIKYYLPKKILDSKIDYLKNFPFKIYHFLPVQSIKNAIKKAGDYTPFDGYVLLPNGKYIILEFKYYNTSEYSINVETLKENFKLAGNKLSLKTGFPITRSKITGQVWSEKNKQWYDGSFVSKFTKKDNKNLFSDLTLQPDFKDPRNTIISDLDAEIVWYIMCSDGLYAYELSKDTDSFYIINNRMFNKNAYEKLTLDKKSFFIDPNKLIKIN